MDKADLLKQRDSYFRKKYWTERLNNPKDTMPKDIIKERLKGHGFKY